MRMEIESQGFGLGRDEFDAAFAPLARQHGMSWRVGFTDRPKRMAIMVSKYAHCLLDLLWRWEAGELEAEIPLVISNHADLAEKVQAHGIPFCHLPVTKGAKAEQEAQVVKLLKEHEIDLVVLARYMQILSPEFLDSYRRPIINIHHSFLPAFIGASPYHQAYARGVKIIGATAHYVTAELDAGPIIHQDVAHISHRDGVEDMIRIGREVERRVLAQARALAPGRSRPGGWNPHGRVRVRKALLVIAAQSDHFRCWLRPRTNHPGAHQSSCRGREDQYTDRPFSTC